MEADQRPLWFKSLLLRVISYSVFTSMTIGALSAWVRRDDPVFVHARLGACLEVAYIASFTFLLSYYVFGGSLWLSSALIEQFSRSPKR